MAKAKPVSTIESYGIYSHWDAKEKDLPQITEFTTDVPAELDIEFGFIVNIKKAKGQKIKFCVYHPNIPDDDGEIMPPFEGEEYVKTNDWQFYLGDTIWAPVDNKVGIWRMTIELNGHIIADKSFNLLKPSEGSANDFWKHRGY
ncbi:DUF3859 domain-containing protein [Pseudoalteromonas lipolytica]|jgi:hypothetical protein|uniref:DUF3859 domain-containing protein n=1 Tax=Pseudoalteromonas lipolytica TaxID=570156 RepID=A0AAD0RZK7_9GAMM|nr:MULTISPECIES: DUF3859 domain-containing protein [Pseudoalteromonas]AXV65311.1 DUF3859 domain-containing protein [Pseudoalteromonas donghaensis]EWH07113.1 hypothetical protein AT00_05285 [Pseudoalteromonas lipolytica SCSIO 04301]MBE0350878.1 hypothetical protein [Pseudoalteromonas lipolytica LMEB 39]MCC9659718.1 DUF3859 domain-containing protein [Pseudoalteromonas sp. MB41]QLJ06853.1 DUF3859 domain-containing protein [Pseudoalteromonas sp. JSTW]